MFLLNHDALDTEIALALETVSRLSSLLLMNLLMLLMLTLACTSEVIIMGSMALGDPQDIEQGKGGEGLLVVDDVVLVR